MIGFFPNIFISQIKGATDRIQADYEERVSHNPPPTFYTGPAVKLLPRKRQATPVVAMTKSTTEKK